MLSIHRKAQTKRRPRGPGTASSSSPASRRSRRRHGRMSSIGMTHETDETKRKPHHVRLPPPILRRSPFTSPFSLGQTIHMELTPPTFTEGAIMGAVFLRTGWRWLAHDTSSAFMFILSFLCQRFYQPGFSSVAIVCVLHLSTNPMFAVERQENKGIIT